MPRSRPIHALLLVTLVAVLVCACNGSSGSTTGSDDQSAPATVQDEETTAATVAPGDEESAAGQEEEQEEEVPDYMACDPAALPFALPPDATQCKHVDIITTYFTTISPDDAIQFQADGLSDAGWTRTDDGAISGMGSWTKGQDQLNFVAGPQDGKTAVQVQELTATP